MRLIETLPSGELRLSPWKLDSATPPYAILSHTWGEEGEEVTYKDMVAGIGQDKAGFKKITFCSKQAEKDNLRYFWVDSCCIKKSSDAELSESLNSMFRWYENAAKCYVYLSDVTASDDDWEQMFRNSRWFTRGWTLQELLAPKIVEFFGRDGRLGDKQSLLQQVHKITGIPIPALQGTKLSQYASEQVFSWQKHRQTSRDEDLVYSLLGIFGISMPIIYGEGRKNAIRRLKREILYKTDGTDQICSPKLVASMSTLVQQTRNVFVSDITTLQRQLAHAYADLAQQRTLLHNQTNIVEENRRDQIEQSFICLHCGKENPQTFSGHCTHIEQSDLTAADIFFDCVSRFSGQENLSASIDRLSNSFIGNPTYKHERCASFYPAMYSTGGLFANPLFVLSIKQSEAHAQLTQHYYLLYAANPRSWYWIVVSITLVDEQAMSVVPQASAVGFFDGACKVLPSAVASILQAKLPHLRLYSSVTKISMLLGKKKANQTTQLLQIRSGQDIFESKMAQEKELLHDIEVSGCQLFKESELQVLSRKSSACFAVKLGSQMCIERKRSFAYAGWDDEPGLSDFMGALKMQNSLRHCYGVARFMGAVIDDQGLRLRGYIYEAPWMTRLNRLFTVANRTLQIIPWFLRELWAKQVAHALADIHSKGFILRRLHRETIGLSADGSAILHDFTVPTRSCMLEDEYRAPELTSSRWATSQEHIFTSRTDIYQFSQFLWMLAEHRAVTNGLRCSRNACTSFPRYQCTAEHAKLIHLPPLPANVPRYFADLTAQCRSADPFKRPTARRASNILSSRCQITRCPRETLEFLKTIVNDDGFQVHCEECGNRAPDTHFHCYICDASDFDLCSECVAQGIHCRVPEHVLVKRRKILNGYVHVSR